VEVRLGLYDEQSMDELGTVRGRDTLMECEEGCLSKARFIP
jgi:hypothetical protein